MESLIQHFSNAAMKTNVPALRPGDTVRVHQKIKEGNKERIQVFEGVVLAVRNGQGINANYTVRRIASGVGVERTFPLHSPNVVKIERTKTSSVRRAKLYYMRERFGRSARLKSEILKVVGDYSEPVAKPEEEAEEPEAVEEIVETPEETTNEETTEVTPTEKSMKAPAEEVKE